MSEVTYLEITVNDLLKLSNPKIIDIRNGQKYSDNHIPGAINISFRQLMSFPEKYLNKGDTYYIYCQMGATSLHASRVLRALGYKVISVKGEYEDYILGK